MSRDALVVYTAISGGYDRLREQPPVSMAGADCVAFLDAPAPSRTWLWRPIHTGFDDPVRNAKIHKILPHRFFPDADYSLWLDGSITARFPFSARRLVDMFLAEHDIAVFQHSRRTCLYQEASVCHQFRLDEPGRIWKQVCRYTQEGFPENAGLAECSVVLRRHTAAVRAFDEAWWDEIMRGSRRDQISFPYVAWKFGFPYATFPGRIEDNVLFNRDDHASFLPRLARRLVRRALRLESWASSRVQEAGLRLWARSSRRGQMASPWPEAAHPSTPVGAPAETEPPRFVQRIERALRRASRNGRPTGVPRPAIRASVGSPRPGGPGRRTIGFGPVRALPSWDWVGFDPARALSRYYDVILYDSWAARPKCDALFIVKEPPPAAVLRKLRRERARLVYCPVDVYHAPDEPERDAALLGACDMVLVHSERLLPLVRPHCRAVHFVEHHLRYALSTRAEYRESGYALWIGGFQYLPYLLSWLESHPLECEIRILTDIDNHRARDRARVLAADIGTRFVISPAGPTVGGYAIETWSERRQEEMMRECKAALDAKATSRFNQYYKPPTKAQQFVASGIPFAVNPESYSAEYLRARGFDVASPVDIDRWFSRRYWEETQDWSGRLRAEASLDAVGVRYHSLLDTLWTGA